MPLAPTSETSSRNPPQGDQSITQSSGKAIEGNTENMQSTEAVKNPKGTPEFLTLPEKSQNLFNGAFERKDTDRLKQIAHPDNKAWRKEFAQRTGLTLPKGVNATNAVVDQWAKENAQATEAKAEPVKSESELNKTDAPEAQPNEKTTLFSRDNFIRDLALKKVATDDDGVSYKIKASAIAGRFDVETTTHGIKKLVGTSQNDIQSARNLAAELASFNPASKTPETIPASKPAETMPVNKSVQVTDNKPNASEMADLKAQMGQAIGELATLLGGKLNLTEEEETRLLPIMSKIFRISAKMGYLKFKESAGYVMQQIRELAGDDIANKLALHNLQAGYINMGGNIRDTLDYDHISQLAADLINRADYKQAHLETNAKNNDTTTAIKPENTDEHQGNGGTGQSVLEGALPGTLSGNGQSGDTGRGSRSGSGTDLSGNGRAENGRDQRTIGVAGIEGAVSTDETKRQLDGRLDPELATITVLSPGSQQPAGLYSKTASSDYSQLLSSAQPKGVSEQQAERALKLFQRGLNGVNGVTFKIYANPQEAFGDGYTETGRVKGFYTYQNGRNTIGIFRDSLDSVQDTVKTLQHETLGHFGLNLFDPQQKMAFLRQVIMAGKTQAVGELFAQVRKDYPELSRDEFKQAEEVFARITEENKQGKFQAVFDRLLNLLMPLLRKAGIVKGAPSRAELRGMVQAIAAGIRRGTAQHTFPNDSQAQFSGSAMKSVEANIKRGREAMTKALLDKTSVHRAMFKTGMGWVDFVWGVEGGPVDARGRRKGAKGIAHIIEARQRKDGLSESEAKQLLFALVNTIAKGKEGERYEHINSISTSLTDGQHRVLLIKNLGTNSWLVTGYEIRPDGASSATDALASTHSESTPSRNEAGAGETNISQPGKSSNKPLFSKTNTSESSERLEALRQYRDVEAKYFNPDGSKKAGAMLAPNGAKTKLNKVQWLLVRTDNFRRFYGDWERSGLRLGSVGQDAGGSAHSRGISRGNHGATGFSEAGGLVDENGEPALFYHGTADDIERFDLAHPNRKDAGWIGRGVYSSNSPLMAKAYANTKQGNADPNIMPLFVGVKNPYIASLDDKRQLKHATQEDIDKLTRHLIAEGYDGALLRFDDGTVELVGFFPEKVKSATGNTGEFNTGNNDIRFSKRNDYTPDAQAVKDKMKADRTLAKLTPRQRMDKAKNLWATKVNQKVFDRYRSFKDILHNETAWMMSRLSGNTGGVVEMAIEQGHPVLDASGAVDIDTGKKSLLEHRQGEIFRQLKLPRSTASQNVDDIARAVVKAMADQTHKLEFNHD